MFWRSARAGYDDRPVAALILAVSMLLFQAPADPAAELAAVRTLYSAANFDEALARLAKTKLPPPLQDQADTYKALCLLALGRAREADQVIEQLLRRNPSYLPDEKDVSPKLVQVFRTVRTRVLPELARGLYTAARVNYDKREFELASQKLRDLLTVIGNANDGSLGELKILAEGFLKLSDTNRPAATPDGMSIGSASDVKGPVYTILDRDVVAPVEITRVVPTMLTPKGTQPRLYQGLIEVIIDENGRVEVATIRRTIGREFDVELLAAASRWRFQPATRSAKPVKYRRAYEIIGHSR